MTAKKGRVARCDPLDPYPTAQHPHIRTAPSQGGNDHLNRQEIQPALSGENLFLAPYPSPHALAQPPSTAGGGDGEVLKGHEHSQEAGGKSRRDVAND